LAGGCGALGYAAAVIPGPPMKARYPGLAGQKVAIMTWTDRAAAYDFGTLQPDVSTGIQNKLKSQAAPDQKQEELIGTTFVDARQVYRWQKNHPELESRSLPEIAPKLAAAVGATRIIYVEVSPFSTRDPRTQILLKGHAAATIRVAEVSGQSVKIAFDESNVAIDFPDHAPEGVPPTDQMNDLYIYKGLVDAVSTQVALRFFSYSEQ
jgi:hypothetical protein